jgi:hypothetical protein
MGRVECFEGEREEKREGILAMNNNSILQFMYILCENIMMICNTYFLRRSGSCTTMVMCDACLLNRPFMLVIDNWQASK